MAHPTLDSVALVPLETFQTLEVLVEQAHGQCIR
jgi:hypothetical protein